MSNTHSLIEQSSSVKSPPMHVPLVQLALTLVLGAQYTGFPLGLQLWFCDDPQYETPDGGLMPSQYVQ